MYNFPMSDKARLLKWVVALNRAGPKPGSLWQPSPHSKLCSLHFASDQFVLSRSFAMSVGYDGLIREKLKDDAVPTIFSWRTGTPAPARLAVVKRAAIANSEFCSDLCNEASTQCDLPIDTVDEVLDVIAMPTEVEIDEPPVHIGIQATPHSVPASCQTNWYLHQRRIGVQTLPICKKTQGTQCDIQPVESRPSTVTQSTQTESLPAFSKANTSVTVQSQLVGGTLPSDQDTTEEEMDDESDEEEVEEDDCMEMDPEYLPSSDEDCDDEDNERIPMDETYEERPIKMRKFIVFESCLRSLLAICSFCLKPAKVTEVKNSYWLEIEGLKRAFLYLSTNGVRITTFVTDRHAQVKKMMKTAEYSHITHNFDVWHVAKGIKKKLEKLAKKKANRKLLPWIHSITNHLYWAAASSNGCVEECSQKWASCVNHVADVHDGHGDIFPQCLHDDLDDRDWLKKGSRLHKQFQEIVTPKALMADIGRLSPGAQTYSLESYHEVVCYFAPKAVHFSYAAMTGRILLAVMHFNENSQRQQSKRKDGTAQWSVSSMKYGKGQPIGKEVKTPVTYEYVQDCLEEVMSMRAAAPSITQAAAERRLQPPAPMNITDKFERQDKDAVIAARKSRFRNLNFCA